MKKRDLISKLIRQNPNKKDGSPGSFSVRLFVQEHEAMKAKRLEIGLGTSNREEAISRAAVAIRALYAAGGKFTHKTWFNTETCHHRVSVARAAAAINQQDCLPLWKWKIYPHADDLDV